MNKLFFKNFRTNTLTSLEELEESLSDKEDSTITNFDVNQDSEEEIDVENLLQTIKSLSLKLKELKNQVSSSDDDDDALKRGHTKEYFVRKYSQQLSKSKKSRETNGIPESLMFEVFSK
jgi:hypothetical protein